MAMTHAQLWETFGVLDSLPEFAGFQHEANTLRGVVTVSRRRAGHVAVEILETVPTADDARAALQRIDRDLASRTKRSARFLTAETALDRE